MPKLSTADQDIKQPKPRVIKEDVLTPMETDIEPAMHIDKEWAAQMAFDKELVTIRVDETGDENEEKVITVWNNGDPMHFPRGQEVTCERRFVEVLMRAKPTKYSQKAVLDDLGKVGGYQEIPKRALRYHFSVVRDDSPLGAAWLRAILSQA